MDQMLNFIRLEKLNQQSQKKETPVQKLIQVLQRLDSKLSTCGLIQFQERIHRISKAIKSIDAHTDCYVSNFTIEDKPQRVLTLLEQKRIFDERTKYNNDYCTLRNDLLEFPSEGKNNTNFTLEMKDLIEFIESELFKEVVDCQKDISSSSESEEEKDDQVRYTYQKPRIKRKIKQDSTEHSEITNPEDLDSKEEEKKKAAEEMRRKFFNIELRLRAFLKQQEKFDQLKGEDFESFLNQSRLKTPMKQIPKMNPCIIKNFFEDSIDLEQLKKKRLTLDPTKLIEDLKIKGLGKNDVKNKKIIQSFEPKIKKDSKQISNEKKVSQFSDIVEDDVELGNDTENLKPVISGANRLSKRGSIFRDPHMFSLQGEFDDKEFFIGGERLRNAESIGSRSDDEEECEDDDVIPEEDLDENGDIVNATPSDK